MQETWSDPWIGKIPLWEREAATNGILAWRIPQCLNSVGPGVGRTEQLSCTLPACTSQVSSCDLRLFFFFFLGSSGTAFTKDRNKPVLFSWSSFLVSQPAPRWASSCITTWVSSLIHHYRLIGSEPKDPVVAKVKCFCLLQHFCVLLPTWVWSLDTWFTQRPENDRKQWKKDLIVCLAGMKTPFHAKV